MANAKAPAPEAKRTSAEAAKGLIAMGGKAPDMQDIPRRKPETDEASANAYLKPETPALKHKRSVYEAIRAERAALDAREAKVDALFADFTKQLHAHDVTPEDYFDYLSRAPKSKIATTSRKAKSDKPAMYRNAEGQTWTGFGKRPQWLVAALGTGKALEDFRIK